MEQVTPAQMPYLTNRMGATTNFFVELSPGFNAPLLQGLPGTTVAGQPNTQDRRTNILQRFFFLTRQNQDWLAQLGFKYRRAEDPADILEYPDSLKKLRPAVVQDAARTYLNTGNYVRVRLVPEK